MSAIEEMKARWDKARQNEAAITKQLKETEAKLGELQAEEIEYRNECNIDMLAETGEKIGKLVAARDGWQKALSHAQAQNRVAKETFENTEKTLRMKLAEIAKKQHEIETREKKIEEFLGQAKTMEISLEHNRTVLANMKSEITRLAPLDYEAKNYDYYEEPSWPKRPKP